MTAPFAADLCGYRPDGVPSTADASDNGSRAWGKALFDALGVPHDQGAGDHVGDRLEVAARDGLAGLRADLRLARSSASSDFEQYRHLGAFRTFQREYAAPGSHLAEAVNIVESLPVSATRRKLIRLLTKAQTDASKNHAVVEVLRRTLAQESLLRIDLTVGSADDPPRLLIAISSKWSLRTDRAQDCVAQGQKLSTLRRGHMPHFAVLTMEPRPSMLRLLAYGSGGVDCVYHVALPELRQAAEDLVGLATNRNRSAAIAQQESLELMVEQRRIRDYADLVGEVQRLRG